MFGRENTTFGSDVCNAGMQPYMGHGKGAAAGFAMFECCSHPDLLRRWREQLYGRCMVSQVHLERFRSRQHNARKHGALVGGREGEQRLVAALLDLLAADHEDLCDTTFRCRARLLPAFAGL